jgi:hypothetical protein
VAKQGGGGFLRDTITRFMGLIVLSIGMQFALTGYHAFMKEATGAAEVEASQALAHRLDVPETRVDKKSRMVIFENDNNVPRDFFLGH